jgi:hypothetical protein
VGPHGVLLEAAEIVVERVAAEVTEADAADLLTVAAVVVVVVTEVAEEGDIQIAAVIAADEVEEEVLTEVEVVEDSEEDVEVGHQREFTSKSSVLWALAIWFRYQSFFHLSSGSCPYFYSLSAFALLSCAIN